MSFTQPTQVQISSYAQKSKDPVLLAPNTKQVALYSARAFNRSGGAIDVGIVEKFNTSGFSVFTFDGSAYTAISTPTAATTIIPVTTGQGFAIQSKKKSGLIGFTVSQASASGTYAYKYWNGSSFTTLTTIEVPDYTSTGDKVVLFLPPSDWVVGGGGALDSTKYTIQVTVASTLGTAIQVSAMWGGILVEFYSSIANNSSVQIEFDSEKPLILDASEGIMPYFGGVANAANGMQVAYSTI